MRDKGKCPVCENEEYILIDIGSNDEYPPYIYSLGRGRIDLIGCTNCGVIRLDKSLLNN